MSSAPLVVVGIGADGPAGLSPAARAHVAAAKVLAGGRRHLEFFPEWRGERVVIGADLQAFVGQLRDRYRREKTIVLASGDPLFFGIGRLLLESFPKEDLLFMPQLSSVQLAFARVKEAWHDALVVSLHGRPLETLVPALAAHAPKIAVLTDVKNHPTAIAAFLRERNAADDYSLWVCENLGALDERVTRHAPANLRDETFLPLNVVILLREKDAPRTDAIPLLGIPETALEHRPGPRGLITRREVRLLALCYLALHPGDVVWDVGAGSGSVSVEAARLAPSLRLFAIERDVEALTRLNKNVARFDGGQIEVVAGAAPEALASLPDPDAVFVGGSGGRLHEILAVVAQRLRPGGRLVINCVTVETFSSGWDCLQKHGLSPEATCVQLSHTRPLGQLHCLEPDLPIFILRACKP